MKLIQNFLVIKVDENSHLIINTLNGLIDVLDEFSYDKIKQWEIIENITPSGEKEVTLYQSLEKRGYLVNDSEEERKIRDDIISKLRKTHNKESNGKHIEFTLTYDCNFRCPYCFEKGREPSKAVISKDMVDAAFSLMGSNVKDVSLFGGEPLLIKNKEIVEYIFSRSNNKNIYITTNGFYLKEYMGLFKSLKNLFLNVTLDGKEQTHNATRCLANGEPTFNKILEGIKICLDSNIYVKLRMNISPETIDECLELKHTLSENLPNAKEYLRFELHPIMQLDIDGRNKVTKDVLADSTDSMSDGGALFDFFVHGKRLKPMYNFCYGHRKGYYHFDPLGYIYSCKAAVGQQEVSIGTYYPEVMFKEKHMLHRNIESIEKCKDCKYAFLCGCGCPLNLESLEDIFQPCCQRTMQDFYTLIPILYKQMLERKK